MKRRSYLRIFTGLIAGITLAACLTLAAPSRAAETPPFRSPFATPPGAATWFVAQWYGNTTWAHDNPYSTGQGLHFGVDFNTPCGTTVVAIGDGVVFAVDGPYGSAPHNLVIEHPNGYLSLYGHLLSRPTVAEGQPVRAGDPIALVGDPAGRCDLDPHLHLEVRRPGMRETVNPVPLMGLDWRRATAGIRRNGTTFERDPEQPARWMTITEQPDVVFGGPIVNRYGRGWP
jgi:murein DD-endopeptidase MepM/ murein hydrolase activator NlpD